LIVDRESKEVIPIIGSAASVQKVLNFSDYFLSSTAHRSSTPALSQRTGYTEQCSESGCVPSRNQRSCHNGTLNIPQYGVFGNYDPPQIKLAQKWYWLQWNAATECNIMLPLAAFPTMPGQEDDR
jgi:hypothetical protein